jgi:hypothetical protein
MQSNGTRIAALLVTLAAVIVLFFVFKGGDDDNDSTTASTEATTTTTEAGQGGGETTKQTTKADEPAVPVIDVVDGQPQGGVAELEFDKGDDVRFDVESNTADEVHVHGYDIEEELPASGTAKFDSPADLEGVFEVELHSSETQIAELTVNP